MGLAEVVRTPQKSGLEALWARAGQAGHLRLEVESARVAEQERSLEEARQHLEQWDYLMEHSTRLEAENAELRAELEAALSAKLAAEAALATTVGERGVCAAAANAQLAVAAEEADRAKEAGLRLLELADHAALVAAAYEDEREGLKRELQATQERLAAAEAAVVAAHSTTHITTDNQLAILDRQLMAAREQHAMAGAAAAAAQEAAQQAAEEKGRLLIELEEAHATLTAAASAQTDSSAATLADQLKDAHEALYEMEMAALEAQRVAKATEAALEDSDDGLEPLRIADTAAQQEEAAEEVALAEDANRRVEEENEALRQQLLRVQEQLQAIQTQPSPGASPEAVHEPTPPKKPAESAALTGHAAAAHAAPVAFYGSHRVFLGAAPTGAVSAEPEQAALVAAASASPVAAEAWCTVTDRLRRLRADLEDTSSAMHQLRSAGKAPPALPMPAAAMTEEAEEGIPMEEPLMPTQLSALDSEAAGAGLPEEACAEEDYAPSPVAEKPSTEGTFGKDCESGPEDVHLPVRAGDSSLPVIKEESKALTEDAQEQDSAAAQLEAQDLASSMGTAPGPDPVQLVLRICRGFTPEPDAVAGTPERKTQSSSRMSESPDTTPPARRPRFGVWGWRGKSVSEDEEREFFRRARALNIRVSPYFRRSKSKTDAAPE
ncbi:g10974 [Coccomyxa viridis]|uniref:G10974 protein n=1 Tax=Coccomyxa viridis TaxID=1274662 RepID=A0ABP1G9E0_9CHLO